MTPLDGHPPSWVDRNDGFESTDEMGRRIRVSVSRFHGAMVTVYQPTLDGEVHEATAYLGHPGPLIAYLTERDVNRPAGPHSPHDRDDHRHVPAGDRSPPRP